jgi:hypothetical protein
MIPFYAKVSKGKPLSFRPILLGFLLLAFSGRALAADPKGLVSLGLQYDGWNSATTLPFKGTELILPLSITYAPDPNWILYGNTSFVSGSYTDSVLGTETLDLSNLTASSITSDYYFKEFGLPNMVELSLTIPTGDPSWETKQIPSSIPTIFINSRYQSEGWGLSGLYALTFAQSEKVEYGVSAGYSYTGAYDPGYGGLTGIQLKMGDSVFLAMTRVEAFANSQSGTFRVSVMAFLPTQENGISDFQMGPNGTASYSFYDPNSFSWTVGAMVYSLSQRYYFNSAGAVVYGPEPFGSSGQRFYFTPSYTWGNLSLGGQAQLVLANGYTIGDRFGLYNGGGFVFGLSPSYALPLDASSALNFTGAYDFVIAHNASVGFTEDVNYNYWTIGANYQLKLF